MAEEAFPGGLVAPQKWLDGLLPKLPGFAVDTIKHEVLQVAREYFSFTTAWRLWIGPILLNAEQSVYALEASDIRTETVIAHHAVTDNGDILVPIDMARAGPPMLYDVGDKPRFYFCPTPGEITFLPLLLAGAERPLIAVLASMTPLDLDIPDHLVMLHYDAITTGVLSRLYMVPGLNYKPDVGQRLARRYSGLRSIARAQAELSYTSRSNFAHPHVAFAQGTYRGWRS